MARKPRLEVEGGLYHIMTRGNNRQRIFSDDDDYQKMLKLVADQKTKLPFYLYAYCLMPNHVHLLIERREDACGRVMHRLLTGYSRYHNRKYGRVGHLFQTRYKAILCQTDQYLAELVRYIHLNPVRAKLVNKPSGYRYSSHRAYLGLDRPGMVDIEPVLRHFGATKKLALERFELFVNAGIERGHCEEYYPPEERRILGSEEFIEQTKKRVGEIRRGTGGPVTQSSALKLEALIEAVAKASGLTEQEICGSGKSREVVMAKEAMIIVGRDLGASVVALAKVMGVHSSVVSRRFDSGRSRLKKSGKLQKLVEQIRESGGSET
jgi:REP element-mobilizing transposase RayT